MGVKVEERKGEWWVIAEENGRSEKMRCRDRKDAENMAAMLRERMAETAPKLTFEQYALKKYLPLAKTYLASQTYRGYERNIRLHLVPWFGNMSLTDIGREQFKSFIAFKQEEKRKTGKTLNPNTIKHMKACLSGILEHAIDDGLIEINPTKGIKQLFKPRKQKRDIPEPYSAEELFRYLEAMRALHPREYPLFLTLARTGMRLGEALGLKWGDIVFEKKWLLIRRTLTEKKREEPPKSGKPRGVTMTNELTDALKAHRAAMEKAFKRKRPEWVFVNTKGNPMDRGNLTNRVHYPTMEAAGLHRIRIHDIRHTYATIRFLDGHKAESISLEMGHSDEAFTKGVYGHFEPTRYRDEINRLDVLGKPNSGEDETGDGGGA